MDFVRLQSYYSVFLTLLTNFRYGEILFSDFHGAYFRDAFQLLHALGVIFCVEGLGASQPYRAFRAIEPYRVAYFATGCGSFGW